MRVVATERTKAARFQGVPRFREGEVERGQRKRGAGPRVGVAPTEYPNMDISCSSRRGSETHRKAKDAEGILDVYLDFWLPVGDAVARPERIARCKDGRAEKVYGKLPTWAAPIWKTLSRPA